MSDGRRVVRDVPLPTSISEAAQQGLRTTASPPEGARHGRAADPSEIGPVIAFVASARDTYMTGANSNVDGGSDVT